jgi:hypothetical protein
MSILEPLTVGSAFMPTYWFPLSNIGLYVVQINFHAFCT